jgi:hypothetical protein
MAESGETRVFAVSVSAPGIDPLAIAQWEGGASTFWQQGSQMCAAGLGRRSVLSATGAEQTFALLSRLSELRTDSVG